MNSLCLRQGSLEELFHNFQAYGRLALGARRSVVERQNTRGRTAPALLHTERGRRCRRRQRRHDRRAYASLRMMSSTCANAQPCSSLKLTRYLVRSSSRNKPVALDSGCAQPTASHSDRAARHRPPADGECDGLGGEPIVQGPVGPVVTKSWVNVIGVH